MTWIGALDDSHAEPNDIGLELLPPNALVGSTRIDVIAETEVPDRLSPGFQANAICCSDVDNGRGQVMTDFAVDELGFIRLEFAAGGMQDLRRSIIIRRLLEVETYRVMALLCLPVARRTAIEVGQLEQSLTRSMETMDDDEAPTDNRMALSDLQALSLRAEKLRNRVGYRFAASRAYGDILAVRLSSLDERQTNKGHQIGRFINNRVTPALATADALLGRLDTISHRLDRAVNLMNLRVGLAVQDQSADTLKDIMATARSQFMLQKTVEGLSVAAVSYYLLGILGYLISGLGSAAHFDKTIALSLAAPLVVVAVWFGLQRIKHTA